MSNTGIPIRAMKKLGIDIPILGMGLMRLPMNGDVVDDAQAIPMVDRLYAAGVRYFDTAYVYMNGESERFAKRALTDRYARDSFCLASKLPGMARDAADAERIFNESCERMGVDYIDFYLLHAMNLEKWHEFCRNGCADFQRKLKADGRIKYAGFSFHGSPDELRTMLEEQPDWDFIQLQLNYYDWYADTARELYEMVAERGIPVIVMEPVRGGGLVELGDDVRAIFAGQNPQYSNAAWAMRWVANLPGVNVILSGVSTPEQTEENVATFTPLAPYTDAEEQTVRRVVECIASRPFIPCTGCNYCSDCPQKVSISYIFSAANNVTRLYDEGKAIWQYFTDISEENRATACIKCGLCAAQCPQRIDIPAELERVHNMLCELRDKQ